MCWLFLSVEQCKTLYTYLSPPIPANSFITMSTFCMLPRVSVYDYLKALEQAASGYSDVLKGITTAPDDASWSQLTASYQQLLSQPVAINEDAISSVTSSLVPAQVPEWSIAACEAAVSTQQDCQPADQSCSDHQYHNAFGSSL